MRLQPDIFRPATTIHPDTVGLYPYTFNGNLHNSAERLQAVADQTGIILMAVELMGQDCEQLYGKSVREALRPGDNFASTCQQTASDLMRYIDSFPHRIGIGHSLGGVVVGGMQLEAPAAAKPFTTVQSWDAFNVRAPQNIVAGHLSFASYQVLDTVQRTVRHRLPSSTKQHPLAPAATYRTTEPPVNSIVKKMRNLSRLMRGTESRRVVERLAYDDTSLPLHVIGLTRGLSGSEEQTKAFLRSLTVKRAQMAEHHDAQPAQLTTECLAGWHSDLMNPAIVSRHLKKAIALARDSG